jgi:hypothetical protein
MGPLTLSEVLGTWTGLGGFAVVRGLFWWMPALIVLVNVIRLLWHVFEHQDARGSLKPVMRYGITSLGILAFLWPEALQFGSPPPPLQATEVVSQAAADDGAPVQNAAQVGSFLVEVGGTTPVPRFVRAVLQVITDGPVRVARAMHETATRPFASTMPLNWLMRHKLDGDIQAAIRDWVHKCVLPAKARLLAAGHVVTYASTLPFGSSALVDAMAGLTVVPARHGFFSFFRSSEPRRCDTYGVDIEDRVLAALEQELTPAGRPLAEVWRDELGISSSDAARWLIYREVLRTAGPDIPAPSLLAEYALIRGLRAVGSVIGGSLSPGDTRAVTSLLGKTGPLAGAVAGGAKGLGNEFSRGLDAVSGVIEPALFVTMWAPELLGQMQMVVLLAFPVVILWCLIPGRQFRPIFVYLTVLVLLYSSPIWWAAIELWSASLGDLRPSPLQNPAEWLRLSIAILVGQTLGIAIVAMGLALVVLTVAGGGALAMVRLIRGQV